MHENSPFCTNSAAHGNSFVIAPIGGSVELLWLRACLIHTDTPTYLVSKLHCYQPLRFCSVAPLPSCIGLVPP